MKRTLSAFVAVAVFFVTAPSYGVLLINNGTSNTINSTVNDFVQVENSPGGAPTTVTFNAGADITGTDSFDDTVFAFDTSVINITGGEFANDVTGYDQTTITITGGQLNDDVYAFDNAVISVQGGTIADDIEAADDSTVFMTGGSVGEDIEAFGATIDISGGQLNTGGDGRFRTDFDGTIVLRGIEFSLDGSPVGEGFISEITGLLSGTLLDGSTFSSIEFDRNPFFQGRRGNILLVTVPEPSLFAVWAIGLGALVTRRRSVREAD